jgi:hypothetical protein
MLDSAIDDLAACMLPGQLDAVEYVKQVVLYH